MIETVTCYRVKCDGCGLVKDYSGEGDALFYSDAEAHETLSREDWGHDADTGQVLCPRCVCDCDGHGLVVYGYCAVCDRKADPAPQTAEPTPTPPADDLLSALRASLEAAGGAS